MSYESDLKSIHGVGKATAARVMETYPEPEDLVAALVAGDLDEDFADFEADLREVFLVTEPEEPEVEMPDEDEEMPEKVVAKKIAKTEEQVEKLRNERAKAQAEKRLAALRARGLIK